MGLTLTDTGTKVTVAVPNFVVSTVEVAFTVMVCAALTTAGAL